MTGYNYKTVAAPRRLKKVKGVKGQDELLAHSVEELIAVEAAQGWEYLRADTFPVEERGGMFSKPAVTERAVLVFRKPVAVQSPQPVQRQAAPVQPVAAPAPQPATQQPQPAPSVGGAND